MQLNINNENLDFGTNILDVDVPDHLRQRVRTGMNFLDDVMGGQGFVPSSVTLFTGEAGAGKSTMLQLAADSLTRQGHTVVLVSGEESPFQIKMTAERLQLKNGFIISQETFLPRLMPKLKKASDAAKAKGKSLVCLFDSLQTLNDGYYADKYGEDYVNAKTAIRALQMVTEFCKAEHAIGIVIGQVNKDGKMAGSNVLKHAVDAHMHLGVETKDKDLEGCRVIEVTKNRSGSNGCTCFLKLDDRGFSVVATVKTI